MIFDRRSSLFLLSSIAINRKIIFFFDSFIFFLLVYYGSSCGNPLKGSDLNRGHHRFSSLVSIIEILFEKKERNQQRNKERKPERRRKATR